MNEFNETRKKEATCREKTLSDEQLRPLCVLIETGFTALQKLVKKQITQPKGNTTATIANWNSLQLNAAYDMTLNGNYAARVSNIRASFEGIIFMHKYNLDKNAAEKWMIDLGYESDKMHAIVKELAKLGEPQFSNYYEHYRNLSKLAHPYPKIRFLFSKEEKGNTIISLGGDYRKKWAGVLLSEILFSIYSTLNEMKANVGEKTIKEVETKEIETFENQYKQFSRLIYKYFAELKGQ